MRRNWVEIDPAYRHFRLLDAAPWWIIATAVVFGIVVLWAFRGCVS